MSDKIEAVEQSVELTDLMVGFSESLAATALAIDNAFTTHPDLKDRAVIYQVPKMSVSVKMTMSYTNGKIRGMLWNKENTQKTTEVTSTISMDFVAVPRQSTMMGWRDLFYTVPLTSGSDVRILQLKLQEYSRLKGLNLQILVDGFFGLQTGQIVTMFQQKEGLERTGTVNKATYAKLCEIAKDPLPYGTE